MPGRGSGRALVIGHRGSSGRLPENTIAAFQGAAFDGADGVELDVRLSADGIPVVIHDATLTRTTGLALRVSDHTAEELQRVPAVPRRRSRVVIPSIPRRAVDLGVPTLERVLRDPAASQFIFYVELKGRRTGEHGLEESVVDTIYAAGCSNRVVVLSFNHSSLRRVRRLDSTLRTAATIAPNLREPRPSARRLLEAVQRAEASEAALHVSLATRRRVELLIHAGVPVSVWTVNSALVGAYLDRIGVGAIMTDHPLRMAGVVGRRGR